MGAAYPEPPHILKISVVYLHKSQSYMGSTKLDVVRNTPPTGARGEVIDKCCIEMLSFGIIYYAAIGNQ